MKLVSGAVGSGQVVGGNTQEDNQSSTSKGDRVLLMESFAGDGKLRSPASVERLSRLSQKGVPEDRVARRPDGLQALLLGSHTQRQARLGLGDGKLS